MEAREEKENTDKQNMMWYTKEGRNDENGKHINRGELCRNERTLETRRTGRHGGRRLEKLLLRKRNAHGTRGTKSPLMWIKATRENDEMTAYSFLSTPWSRKSSLHFGFSPEMLHAFLVYPMSTAWHAFLVYLWALHDMHFSSTYEHCMTCISRLPYEHCMTCISHLPYEHCMTYISLSP
jgi:hypothetical protein